LTAYTFPTSEMIPMRFWLIFFSDICNLLRLCTTVEPVGSYWLTCHPWVAHQRTWKRTSGTGTPTKSW
jgi:hypothetical protein